MPLKHETVSKVPAFDIIDCPVCGKNDFTSVEHSVVYCDNCYCRFSIRSTAGDPGCVVDANLDYLHSVFAQQLEKKGYLRHDWRSQRHFPRVYCYRILKDFGETPREPEDSGWIISSIDSGFKLWGYLRGKTILTSNRSPH